MFFSSSHRERIHDKAFYVSWKILPIFYIFQISLVEKIISPVKLKYGKRKVKAFIFKNQLSLNIVGIVVGIHYQFVKYWATREDLFYRGVGGVSSQG